MSIGVAKVGDEVVVAFDHVDHLEDTAVGLEGKIAEQDQLTHEWGGPNVWPKFWSATHQQSDERCKMLPLGDDLPVKSIAPSQG